MWEKIINKHILVLLTAIILLTVMLRFWGLTTNPPALTWDEVSWGYNAYTIGITGRDEFGALPITYLESFGDFKPPMYAILTVVPVWIFGMNEFSVRFTSAFFGSLAVFVTYFLILELFFQSKNRRYYALATAFILAISPWHILLSRAAFEANVATFFIVVGVYLFLFSTREKRHLFLLTVSLLSFLAAMYTFNTSRVFLPIFVPVLFIFRYKFLIRYKAYTLVSLLFPLVLSIPLALFMFTPQAKLRYEEVNIFSDIKVIERVNTQAQNIDNNILSKLIYNRRFAYAVEYMSHYLDNLNPIFLFVKGDGNPKFSVQDVGQMYIWELPFLVIGAFLLVKKREGAWVIIPFWLLLGIVPAGTARETPHALRIETTIPMLQLISAYGLVLSIQYVNGMRKLFKYSMYAVLCLSILVTCIYFVHNYFNHYPAAYASEWQYGYKEAVEYSETNKNKYKNIYMTKDLGRPYVYVLFFGRYSPDALKNNAEVEREALGFVHVNTLGNYKFSSDLPEPSSGNLYINTPEKTPNDVKILKRFYMPDGKVSLNAYEK